MNRQPIKFDFKSLTMKQKALINREIIKNRALRALAKMEAKAS